MSKVNQTFWDRFARIYALFMKRNESGTEHAGKCAHFLLDSDIPALALAFAALFYFFGK